jgi:hypothetical protein
LLWWSDIEGNYYIKGGGGMNTPAAKKIYANIPLLSQVHKTTVLHVRVHQDKQVTIYIQTRVTIYRPSGPAGHFYAFTLTLITAPLHMARRSSTCPLVEASLRSPR